MRIRSPVSRGSFSLRFSALDLLWAAIAPPAVLWLRGAQALSGANASDAAVFCAISFCCALASFLIFRTRDGLTHLFSVHDALEVGKAVFLAELLTAFLMFSLTRLDGIPRSVLALHGLFLIVGLLATRTAVRMASAEVRSERKGADVEHVLFFGANRLSALYISFLTTYAPGRFQIVGILDDAPSMLARSVAGTRVLGRTDHFLPLLHEFREHGVLISRLLIGSDTEALTEEEHAEIERICREFEIQFDFIPCLVGLADLKSHATLIASQPDTCNLDLAVPTRQYVHLKRGLDLVLATVLMVLSAPFVPFVMALVLLDVGSPVLFWQRRVGLNGRSFQLYKFRTLKPSYDQFGSPVADGRASWVGALLRRLRLDELPQLMNVIVGDMSLIGPRPLLPKDQPRDPRLRLSVRPGITGWAQVNGGTLLTADQKSRLDEWYVRNSSFRIDMTILWRTIVVLFRGERAPVEAPVLAELQSVAADGGSSGSSPAEVSVA